MHEFVSHIRPNPVNEADTLIKQVLELSWSSLIVLLSTFAGQCGVFVRLVYDFLQNSPKVTILFCISIKRRCFRWSNDCRVMNRLPFYLLHSASTCLLRQSFVTTNNHHLYWEKWPLGIIFVLNSSVFTIFLLLFLACICFLPSIPQPLHSVLHIAVNALVVCKISFFDSSLLTNSAKIA